MENKPIPHYLLESFLAAAKEESFQVAAAKVGLTQSALSRQMQLLEESLPHKIFTFSGRKKVLTKYGQTLFEVLEPTFSQTQGLIEQASLLHSEPKMAHIKICGRGELLDVLASQLKFEGQVSFFGMDSTQAMQSVLNRSCDIGIIYAATDSPELVLKPIFSNRLRVMIPKKLLRNKPTTKEELAEKLEQLPCLLYKTLDPVAEKFLKNWGVSWGHLNISRVYANYTTLLKMLNDGLGWAVIPSNHKVDEDNFHIMQLTGNTQDVRTFYLCYRSELRAMSWLKELVKDLKSMHE